MQKIFKELTNFLVAPILYPFAVVAVIAAMFIVVEVIK